MNNWNEERKRAAQEQELTEKLYEELEAALEYNKGQSLYFEKLYDLIDRTLSLESPSEIKTLLGDTKDDPNIIRLSFTKYITDTSRDYEPNIEVYKAAVSDGSIKLITDEAFLSMLRENFVRSAERVDYFFAKELAHNEFMRNHIATHYANLFVDPINRVDGQWNQETVTRLMEAIIQDGSIRYQLHEKLGMIRTKKIFLDRTIERTEEFLKLQGRIPNQ